MKIRLSLFLLLLLYGCKGVQIEKTNDLIAFGSGNLDIYLVNVNDKTEIKLISSYGDVGYYSPFWLNERKVGFSFFFSEVTSKTEYPLGVYDVSKGKVKIYNSHLLILGIRDATKLSDTSVIVPNTPYVANVLQLNSLDTMNLVDLHSLHSKRGLEHLRISSDKNRLIFAGLDSVKSKFLPLTPTGYVRWGSDSLDDIYVYNISEKTLTQLTNTNCCDRDPTWSPDGEHIAYSSNSSGNYEIYVMDKDGENIKQLTDNPAKDTDPEYSPEGDRIAFISGRSRKGQIWVMNADGSNVVQLTDLEDGAYGPLSWSPAK